ncbi:cytochrome o ubiquinol oxidase subunit IV [Lysobacter gummosus]|uniref:Cytochrome bo(3) ubiquinol oxidase subunit 4 n=1 Tax=Lysobacter gummosus TaxID=262324 RepID=A0ABY3XCE6_9GAMM|nr:cytochrome o ubiquinol oxidase subunit IV [Lysobacter gummosus]ALN93764.1 cytochrome o ubiquinol oxidase subunit IV [Lysobacter gummosus]UNP29199.1 cytochrome o ubiquinol oxidase subunit IV [Lysobacter gummosus]
MSDQANQGDVPINQPHLVKPHLGGYAAGFAFAVILTAVPFAVAGYDLLDRRSTLLLIALFAAIQAAVHVRFFLHWSGRRTPVEATIALVFTTLVIAIMIGGGSWVMSDLHHRMMP